MTKDTYILFWSLSYIDNTSTVLNWFVLEEALKLPGAGRHIATDKPVRVTADYMLLQRTDKMQVSPKCVSVVRSHMEYTMTEILI